LYREFYTGKYLDDESCGLACKYLPVVDTSACPRVACTSEIGAFLSSEWDA
jgi:hypothetical protein